ncbi:helix-turn-helix domain-containing protein [Erwinia sp. E_sp_B04_7]|uniref:helix-turn-helix domain-containing protein n=1 Tax=unclassified Erwinia TaxID=2622719 RepID=UPI0030D5B293
MEIKLHANATTTPRIRRYIQQSAKSDRELAQELGISVPTVRRWRKRQDVADRHTTPDKVRKALTDQQASVINWLRLNFQIPLDELLNVVNEGMQQPISRAGLDRYLRGATERNRAPLRGRKALKAGERPGRLSVHYQRVSLLAEEGGEQHILWAEEKLSGWLNARAFAGASPMLVVNWLQAIQPHCPGEIHLIETENKKLFGDAGDRASPLQQWCTEQGTQLLQRPDRQTDVTLRLDTPLADLLPVATDKSLDALLQLLCATHNVSWTQKKLGGLTPEAFWHNALKG